MQNFNEDNYIASRQDKFWLCMLGVVFILFLFLSQFGCDNHDPKPSCNPPYQSNQN